MEDIDEFGQKPTDPDAQPMRNCNWSSRSHAEESKNSQQHLLKKKRKDVSADLKSEHAKKGQ